MEDTQNRGEIVRKSRSFLLRTHDTKLRVFNEEGILQSEEQINQANQHRIIEYQDLPIEYQRCLRRKQSHFQSSETSPKNEKLTPSPKNFMFSQLMTSLKVKQITNNFLNSLSTRRFQFLKNKQYSLIDDKSTDFHQRTVGIQRKENKAPTYNFFEQAIKYVPIFYPQNGLKLTWDIVLQITVIAYFFCIPIHLSLDISLGDLINEQILEVMLLVILIDIVINFNTGYFHKGQFVISRRSIALNYFQHYLLIDIISCVPLVFYFLLKERVISFLLLLFFMKTNSFAKTFRKFEELTRMKQTALNILQLFKLLFTVLFFTHIFACVWIFIGENSSSAKTWLTARQLIHSPWYSVYLNAYYFVTVTMVTVGYGDIVPENQFEMVISILMMLISCGVYAYTLNRVGAIFEELYHQQRQTQRDLMILNNYMDQKNISFSLKYQIREYLDYYWRESNQNNDQIEHTILAQLSDTLRQNLLIEANKIILKDSPIFNQNFSERLLHRTLALIQEAHFTPEQEIFLLNQQEDNFIYFIEKGKVELFVSLSQRKGRQMQQKSLKIISEGESFGVRSFFLGAEKYMSARSVDFTKLLFIRRNEFLELLKEFPEDYETFCMIRDMLFQGSSQKIGKKCYCCDNSSQHDFMNCPYIHYIPNKYKVIRTIYGATQPRDSEFTRVIPTKANTLTQISTTQQIATNFQSKNSKLFKQLSWVASSFQSFPNSDYSFSHSEGGHKPNDSDGTLSKNEEQSQFNSTPQNRQNIEEKDQENTFSKEITDLTQSPSDIPNNHQITPFDSQENNQGQNETHQPIAISSKIMSLQNLSEANSSDGSDHQTNEHLPLGEISSNQENIMREIPLFERKHRTFKNFSQIKLKKPSTPKILELEHEESPLKITEGVYNKTEQVHILSHFYGQKYNSTQQNSANHIKNHLSLSSCSSSSSSSQSISSSTSPQFPQLQGLNPKTQKPQLSHTDPTKDLHMLLPPRLSMKKQRSSLDIIPKPPQNRLQRKNTDSPTLKNPKNQITNKKDKLSQVREHSGSSHTKRRPSISISPSQFIRDNHANQYRKLSIQHQHNFHHHLSPYNYPSHLAHLSHLTNLARRSSFQLHRAPQSLPKPQINSIQNVKKSTRQSSSSSSTSFSSSTSSSIISLSNTIREPLVDIDKLRLFKKYYPRFNFDDVIKMINQKLQRNLRKTQGKSRPLTRKHTVPLGNKQTSQLQSHLLSTSSPFSSINKKPQVITQSDHSFRNNLNLVSGKSINIPGMRSLEAFEDYEGQLKKQQLNGIDSMVRMHSLSVKNFYPKNNITNVNTNNNNQMINQNNQLVEQSSNYNLLTPSHQHTTANLISLPPSNNFLKKRVPISRKNQIGNRRKSHIINPVTFQDKVIRRYSASQETIKAEVSEQLQQTGHNELLSGMSSQIDTNKQVLSKSDLQSIKSIQENASQVDFDDRLDSIQCFEQNKPKNSIISTSKNNYINNKNKFHKESQKKNTSHLRSYPSSVSSNSQMDFKYPDVLLGLDQQDRLPNLPCFSPTNGFEEITPLRSGDNKPEPNE